MLKKWSTKKKIAVTVVILVISFLFAGLLYFLFKPAPPPKVILTTVSSGDVVQTLDATGTVESANQESFSILNGTKVTTVNVRVGDRIKEGDLLATFDTASLSGLIGEKEKAYKTAYETYTSSKKAAKISAAELVAIKKDILSLESEIKGLEQAIAATANKNDPKTETTDKSIADKINSFFEDNLILQLLRGETPAIFDLSSITGMSADQTKLTSLKLELIQLQAKQTIADAQASGILESTLKSIYESTLEDYNKTKAAVDGLQNGWIAKNEGIIREINIVAGQNFKSASAIDTKLDLSAMLSVLSSNSESADIVDMIKQFITPNSSGMTVEYYPFAANFILGKYDVLKITMDQEAKIVAADGKTFGGKITFISPVASSSSSININSLLGSSGSSSGVEAKVSIDNPDTSIIIGFDVAISIDVDKAENATLVPAEAIQFDSEGSYIFLYNSKTKRVERKQVKTGIFSGALYQVISGCEAGDIIVKAPPMTLKDGEKVSIQSTETPSNISTTKKTETSTATTVAD
ncbi:MAG: biotin/lipoyl-binding protein [Clostridiales bacterium]|nr:biotin/lipoyl-binding protein [Clostridiales bacterium]